MFFKTNKEDKKISYQEALLPPRYDCAEPVLSAGKVFYPVIYLREYYINNFYDKETSVTLYDYYDTKRGARLACQNLNSRLNYKEEKWSDKGLNIKP